MLIPTELDDIAKDIPQLPLASLVGAEIFQQWASKGSRVIPPSCAHALMEPMGTIQSVHPGDNESNGGIVVQGITLRMRGWGRSHRRRVHHRLELSLLVNNASWKRRTQHRRVTSVNDRLRGVIELGCWGSRWTAIIIEHGGLWAMKFLGIHCLWSNARV